MATTLSPHYCDEEKGKPATADTDRELVRALAESSPAMLWMGDQYGKCMFLNRALRVFWGVDPDDLAAFDWSSTVHPEDVEKLAGPFGRAMAEQRPFTVEARYLRADGTYRTMRTIANPRFDAKGGFLGMTGVNIDITEQLAAEEHTRLLMGELNHRTKNILSVVQAIARKTAAGSDPDSFIASFVQRLQGLSASNDLLLRTDWSGVQLDELVRAQLSHLADFVGSRITVGGPAIRIGSRQAQTLGMALHELATNSLKYGALAKPEGRVHVNWTSSPEGGWQMEWREETPAPPPRPSRKGFGHTVIVDMIAKAFDAQVTIDFPQSGFLWRVAVPARR